MIKAKRGLQMTLACGRRLYVDLLVIETELAQLDTVDIASAELPLLVRRRSMDVCEEPWFEQGPVHYILPPVFPDDSTQGERAVVSVLLWSDPIEEGFAFSELMVVFFIEWNEGASVARLMQEALRDLDWDGLAVDRCAQTQAADPRDPLSAQVH